MEDYNKIIESLGIKFLTAKHVRVLKPLVLRNHYDVENTLILLHRGRLTFGEDHELLTPGDLLFIPGGRPTQLAYGQNGAEISFEAFVDNKDNYYESVKDSEGDVAGDHYSYLKFEAKVFDSVNFFASLDIPPFAIRSERLKQLMEEVVYESNEEITGKARIIKNNTDSIVVEVVRYVLDNRLFVEQLATNSTYFKDPRLINIFAYIKEHLGGDLSNKVLAGVANVSEDYVGQYFKMLTGINPQDYIEYQRMEKAVSLLRTTKKSIREIGREVGYKDTAYFCRRFKMMFGIPAGKMRRRESLMNV